MDNSRFAEIKAIIKDWHDIGSKFKFLRRVGREYDKYKRLIKQAERQGRIVNTLIDEYKQLYGEDLRANGK